MARRSADFVNLTTILKRHHGIRLRATGYRQPWSSKDGAAPASSFGALDTAIRELANIERAKLDGAVSSLTVSAMSASLDGIIRTAQATAARAVRGESIEGSI